MVILVFHNSSSTLPSDRTLPVMALGVPSYSLGKRLVHPHVQLTTASEPHDPDCRIGLSGKRSGQRKQPRRLASRPGRVHPLVGFADAFRSAGINASPTRHSLVKLLHTVECKCFQPREERHENHRKRTASAFPDRDRRARWCLCRRGTGDGAIRRGTAAHYVAWKDAGDMIVHSKRTLQSAPRRVRS